VSKPAKYWLTGLAVLGLAVLAAFIAASTLARRFEPMLREQAIRYLSQRFHSDIQLAELHITPPRMSTLDILLRRGRGAMVGVEGVGLSMHFAGAPDLPPLFTIQKLNFSVDLGTLTDRHKTVPSVSIQGMRINIPPKGSVPQTNSSESMDVRLNDVQIRDALLVLLPKDSTKPPLEFQIAQVHLKSVGIDSPMHYDATLTIPKPPGALASQGNFGPWLASEPGDTPLRGDYVFEHADLGVFNAIAGTLSSTGTFEGTLNAVRARGQATVPDFRLKSVGTPVPLSTRFEVLVDGTNGNTVLEPVRAGLGNTSFTTEGAVLKHEKQAQRSITLKVEMPKGDMRDLLRLAVKGPPFLEGVMNMHATIKIPPLTGSVKEKLFLEGDFNLQDAKFLRSTIQAQIDTLSRRGQGQPKNQEIDQVASHLKGSFRLENQIMTFGIVSFEVPGAAVALAGVYDLESDLVDFHGSLALDARISEMVTGWKRWLLKPVDPFFAKHGAGTYLHIKVDGTSHQPKFGLDRGNPAP
jgi:AsmA-like C-terminal region